MSEVEEYIPAADEPSPFTGAERPYSPYSQAWANWDKKQRSNAHYAKQKEEGRDVRSYVPFVDFSCDHFEKQEKVRQRILSQLRIDEPHLLPLDAPAMFVEGTRNVSLAWMIHKCRQFAKTPDEVMVEVNELKALDGELVHDQPWHLANWKGWLEVTEDVRVRTFIDSDWGKFYDFQLLIAPHSNVIRIDKRVGDGGRIATPVATLQVLDGEALVKFINKEHFGMHDLFRVMTTFSSSMGYKAR